MSPALLCKSDLLDYRLIVTTTIALQKWDATNTLGERDQCNKYKWQSQLLKANVTYGMANV